MKVIAYSVLAVALVATLPANAAPSNLVVVGHGLVRTSPEVASLSFSIRGEGSSADAAALDLVHKRDAIVEGLTRLLGSAATVHLGRLSVLEARDNACDAEDEGNRPRLSTGLCVVRGYVAEIAASLRLSPVTGAGTALGLATRLGASGARVNGFGLRDPEEARQRAETAAVADAQKRAAAIATAAGRKLGELVSVSDQSVGNPTGSQDIIVTAQRLNSPQSFAAPAIQINLNPEPIETSASMVVTYSIGPS